MLIISHSSTVTISAWAKGGGRRVIFGFPCEANTKWCEALKQAAAEAGFGNIELLEEPKGALLSDLGSGLFNLSDVMQGYLVVDFGGGTCDFAFFRNGEILHAWGDMHLGGRLFDDLFYQWFREQNPNEAEKIEREGNDFYVMTLECREFKEWFSETVGSDPDFANGKKKLGAMTNGHITGLSKEEFLRRAKKYTPSEAFRNILERLGQRLPDKLSTGKPVDLIAWFQESLQSGLNEKGLSSRSVKVISLAGGSSRWFFVKEHCCQILGNKEYLFQSPRPYAAISEGLAKYPATIRKFDETRRRIIEEKPKFLRNGIIPHVMSELEAWKDKIVDDYIIDDIFDGAVKPVLEEFRNKGGTLGSLQAKIQNAIGSRESFLKDKIEKSGSQTMKNIADTASLATKKWLCQFDLKIEDIGVSTVEGRLDPIKIPISLNNFMTAMGVIIATIASNGIGFRLWWNRNGIDPRRSRRPNNRSDSRSPCNRSDHYLWQKNGSELD